MSRNTSGLRPPWPKGVSGNPGGRPKKSREFAESCQELAEEARDVLAQVMRDKSASAAARVNAATTLIERSHGKPQQDMNLNVKKSIDDFSDEELTILAGYDSPLGDGGEERTEPTNGGAGTTH